MSRPFEPVIGEIRQEAATTRRVLERVPEDKLGWKPHPKSMTLGQLAMHVAMIPGAITRLAAVDEFEVNPASFAPPLPNTTAEILETLDSSIQAAEKYLGGVSESAAMANWRAVINGRELMSMPRATMVRALMLNHWYHHRGQLSVYLRLLQVPVPSIYGPSADDNPFV
ncbi:MAG TPA: DinB family protein [Bryobacteraceae bacterium]|nr:DinB family protein [Bryobacteraceae bacterium]